MMMLLAMAMAFWLQKAVPDLAAAVRGQTPPSHEYRMEKLRSKDNAPAQPNASPRPRKAPVGEVAASHWRRAVERANHRAELRHRDKLALIDERAPKRSEKWLERKLAAAQRREQRRESFAAKAGVVTSKAREAAQTAAEQLRERRAENQAWKKNGRRDAEPSDKANADQSAEGEPAPSQPSEPDAADGDNGDEATVLPFKPRNAEPGQGGDQPLPEQQQTEGSPLETEPGKDPAQQQEGDGVDDEERRVPNPYGDNDEKPNISVAELRRRREAEATAAQSDRDSQDQQSDIAAGKQDVGDGDPAADGAPAPQGASTAVSAPQAPTASVNTNEGNESMTTTSGAVGEINSLGTAKAYADSMRTYLGQVQSKLDADVADQRTMAGHLKQELATSELAIAKLHELGMQGTHVDSLSAAYEKLAQIQQAMDEESQRMATLLESAATAREAYMRAFQAFESQSGLAEQVQAANASGATAAKTTEFYANA